MTQRRSTKSEATQERILNTALALFAERGYANATMRDIAAQAGCSLGLAYRYFPSKDAMVLTLYERLVVGLEEEIEALPGSSLAQRWAHVTRADFGHLQAYRGALTGLASAAITPGSSAQLLGPDTLSLRLRMLTLFTRLVNGAKDTPAPEVARALAPLLYLLHLLLVFFWLQDPTPNQRITAQLIDFGEELFGRMRLLLRLPWTATAVTQLSGILTPVLKGTAHSESLAVTLRP